MSNWAKSRRKKKIKNKNKIKKKKKEKGKKKKITTESVLLLKSLPFYIFSPPTSCGWNIISSSNQSG